MSDPARQDDSDRREHDPVDNHALEAESTGEPGMVDSTISSTDEEHQYEVAELNLVDALLDSMSDRAARERQRRVRSVMQAIGEEVRVGQPRSHLTRWMTIAAVAAAFLIAVALFSVHSARNALANEVLSAVNRASAVSIDRVYTVRRVLGSPGRNDLPRGTLYLRGREGLLLIWGDAILGRTGAQFWLLTDGRHVTVAESFDWIDAEGVGDQVGVRFFQELSLNSVHVPLMQLASVAELMQYDYELELTRVRLDGEAADLLVGRRRSSAIELPERIRLWADADSRIVRRAELAWDPANAVIFELAPEESVPADWYSYSAHCNGEPIVRRIPSGG
jgi:hypothetical protein